MSTDPIQTGGESPYSARTGGRKRLASKFGQVCASPQSTRLATIKRENLSPYDPEIMEDEGEINELLETRDEGDDKEAESVFGEDSQNVYASLFNEGDDKCQGPDSNPPGSSTNPNGNQVATTTTNNTTNKVAAGSESEGGNLTGKAATTYNNKADDTTWTVEMDEKVAADKAKRAKEAAAAAAATETGRMEVDDDAEFEDCEDDGSGVPPPPPPPPPSPIITNPKASIKRKVGDASGPGTPPTKRATPQHLPSAMEDPDTLMNEINALSAVQTADGGAAPAATVATSNGTPNRTSASSSSTGTSSVNARSATTGGGADGGAAATTGTPPGLVKPLVDKKDSKERRRLYVSMAMILWPESSRKAWPDFCDGTGFNRKRDPHEICSYLARNLDFSSIYRSYKLKPNDNNRIKEVRQAAYRFTKKWEADNREAARARRAERQLADDGQQQQQNQPIVAQGGGGGDNNGQAPEQNNNNNRDNDVPQGGGGAEGDAGGDDDNNNGGGAGDPNYAGLQVPPRQPKNPHFLSIYGAEPAKRPVAEKDWQRVRLALCQKMNAELLAGSAWHPAQFGWVASTVINPEHGFIRPESLEGQEYFINLVDKIVVDGFKFRAWTDKALQATVVVEIRSSVPDAQMLDDFGLPNVAAAVIKLPINGLHDLPQKSCQVVHKGYGPENFQYVFFTLELDAEGWKRIQDRNGIIYFTCIALKAFHKGLEINKELPFPANDEYEAVSQQQREQKQQRRQQRQQQRQQQLQQQQQNQAGRGRGRGRGAPQPQQQPQQQQQAAAQPPQGQAQQQQQAGAQRAPQQQQPQPQQQQLQPQQHQQQRGGGRGYGSHHRHPQPQRGGGRGGRRVMQLINPHPLNQQDQQQDQQPQPQQQPANPEDQHRRRSIVTPP